MRKAILTFLGAALIISSTQAALSKEHHRVSKAHQFTSERFRNSNAAMPASPEAGVEYDGGMGGWASMTGFN